MHSVNYTKGATQAFKLGHKIKSGLTVKKGETEEKSVC